MNRILRAEAIIRERMAAGLTEEQVATLDKAASLDLLEIVALQNMQARLHAMGQLTLDEASVCYRSLMNWDATELPLRVAIVACLMEANTKVA